MSSVKAPRPEIHGKCERALELREKYGLTPRQIADRLGSNPRSVAAMISNAKKRRDAKVDA